jgi:hypothetical protein
MFKSQVCLLLLQISGVVLKAEISIHFSLQACPVAIFRKLVF